MRPFVRSLALLFVTMLVFCPGSADAQRPGQLGRARIPFAFEWNGTHLLAGNYALRLAGASVMLDDGRVPVLALPATVEAGRVGRRAQIDFHCVAGQCFLREIWLSQSGYHFAFLPAKAERRRRPQAQPQLAGAADPKAGEEAVVVSLE